MKRGELLNALNTVEETGGKIHMWSEQYMSDRRALYIPLGQAHVALHMAAYWLRKAIIEIDRPSEM